MAERTYAFTADRLCGSRYELGFWGIKKGRWYSEIKQGRDIQGFVYKEQDLPWNSEGDGGTMGVKNMKYILAGLVFFLILFGIGVMNIAGRESEWERRRELERLQFPEENDEEGDEYNAEAH